jgi:hypothetical protein
VIVEDGVRNGKGYGNEREDGTGDRESEQESTVRLIFTMQPVPAPPTVVETEKYGILDAFLSVLVRIVLASVWLWVALGWVLDRISDVLAALIEQCLAWLHPLQ